MQKKATIIHKDIFVATAEALWELQGILEATNASEVLLGNTKVQIALVGGTKIEMSVLTVDRRPEGIVYILDRRGPPFDLMAGDMGCKLNEALRFATYVRDVVIADAESTARFLKSWDGSFSLEKIRALPHLPTVWAPLRATTAQFTPRHEASRMSL